MFLILLTNVALPPTTDRGSVDRSNKWGNGGCLEVTVYFNTAHISVTLQLRTCVTSLPQFNYFQQEKDILNWAILDKPYLELGKILPMLAFWIVTTDLLFVVNRYKTSTHRRLSMFGMYKSFKWRTAVIEKVPI